MSSTKPFFQSLAQKPETFKELMFYPVLKRLFDLVMASLGLLLLLPVGLLLALLIKLSDGGPIFYTQIRIGQWGRSFPIRKFRSMVVNADQIGSTVTPEGDPRITWIGRWLRKTKLDELPQLWNVLAGQMSFVGPRPEVPRYVERYTPEQREILKYKPGITDMATLLFRNEETLLRGSHDVEQFYVQYCLPRKITLNRQYAQRASLAQDFWIIIQTLCPYWVGVVTIYGVALVASLWTAYQLRFDFQVTDQTFREFVHFLPLMVFPQLFLLVWRGQVRGLLSYFSIPEMRQTASALGIALALQLGLWVSTQGRLSPSRSIILIHFIVSLMMLCGVRITLRFIRERSSHSVAQAGSPVRRVAIIGTGELATNLALDFGRNKDGGLRVVAFFDDNPRSWNKRPHDIPVIGMPECILNREWLEELDEVIVALPEEESPRAQQIGELLKGSRLRVTFASTWPVLRPLTA
jgi:lipopolysaccharide/colanic/teichoic acid biosynthesis glycosyltransferase